MGRKTIIAVGALALAALGATVLAQNAPVETRPPITPYKPAFSGQTRAPERTGPWSARAALRRWAGATGSTAANSARLPVVRHDLGKARRL